MRNVVLISSVLMLSATHVAMAQEQPNSQTLDGQMQRVEQGQPAVPMATPAASSPAATQTPMASETPPPSSPENIPMVTSDAIVTPAAPAASTAEPATQALDNQMKPATKEEPAKAETPAKKPVAKKTAAKAHKSSTQLASAQAQGNAANPDLFTKPIPTPAVRPAVLPVARNGEAIDSSGGNAIPALPLSVMEQNGVKYITGGVGSEEETQLKSVAGDFNVQLMITAAQGEYLGNAMVRVLDDKGTQLVSVDHGGPYFYTHLNPGNYTVEVTAKQGGIKTLPIKVASSGTVKDQIRFSE